MSHLFDTTATITDYTTTTCYCRNTIYRIRTRLGNTRTEAHPPYPAVCVIASAGFLGRVPGSPPPWAACPENVFVPSGASLQHMYP